MKSALSLLVCVIAFFSATAQLEIQWNNTVGGPQADWLNAIVPTSDGGFIAGGSSYSHAGGDKSDPNYDAFGWSCDYWIIKMNADGEIQWERTYGGFGEDRFAAVRELPEGGYIISGFSYSGIGGDKTEPNWESVWNGTPDYWLLKIDESGNVVWDKTLGGEATEYFGDIWIAENGDILVAGQSFSGISGNKTQENWGLYSLGDFWLVRLNSSGNILWDQRYGGDDNEELFSVRETHNGNILLGGRSQSGISGNKTEPNWAPDGLTYDYWVVMTNSEGDFLWDKRYGGEELDNYTTTIEALENGEYVYYLCGTSRSYLSGDKTEQNNGPANWNCNDTDYWVVKMDEQGNKIWDHVFGGLEAEIYLSSAFLTAEGNILLGGSTSSDHGGDKTENNLAEFNSWFIEITPDGGIVWDKTLLNDFGDVMTGFGIQMNNGCYILGNYTASGWAGDKTEESIGDTDYWFLNYCDLETTQINSTTDDDLLIFPNPCTGSFQVTLPTGSLQNLVSVFDLHGKLVTQQKVSGQLQLDVSEYVYGCYLVRVVADNAVYTEKLIVE